jgi:hypothetical protein
MAAREARGDHPRGASADHAREASADHAPEARGADHAPDAPGSDPRAAELRSEVRAFDPRAAGLRVSDAERDRTVEVLRTHAGDGRLDAEELEERIGRALGARTRADLAAIVADLPRAPRPTAATARHRKDPRAFVPIALLLIAIWAATGAGYFWPVWPLMWFAFASFAGSWRGGNTRVIR